MTARTSLFRFSRNACAVIGAFLFYSNYEAHSVAQIDDAGSNECINSEILVTKSDPVKHGCGACQPISKSKDGSMYFANPSTSLRTSNGKIILIQGKLVLFTDKTGMKVTADHVTMHVPANSCCVIEVPRKRFFRGAQLLGRASLCALESNSHQETITIEAGEELCTFDGDPETFNEAGGEELLIPKDHVDRERIKCCIGLPRHQMAKSKFDQEMLFMYEPLFNCSHSRSFKAKSKVAFLKKSLKKSLPLRRGNT